MTKESLREKFKAGLLPHLHTASQSLREENVNVHFRKLPKLLDASSPIPISEKFAGGWRGFLKSFNHQTATCDGAYWQLHGTALYDFEASLGFDMV